MRDGGKHATGWCAQPVHSQNPPLASAPAPLMVESLPHAAERAFFQLPSDTCLPASHSSRRTGLQLWRKKIGGADD